VSTFRLYHRFLLAVLILNRYWSAAVAHLSRLKRDKTLVEAAERLWISTTERKMYITVGRS
jgi:DUF1680 family protein